VLKELASGVYYEDGYHGGNVGLVRTNRGALLIDTPMFPPEARQWQLALLQLGVPSLYGIVNTDYHPEHFLGNHLFMPTRVFGHELSARPIAKYETANLEFVANTYREQDPVLADEIMRLEVHPPEITVSDTVSLHISDEPIQVLYLNGHTPASLGVFLPEKRILFAGDNVTNNAHPAAVHANSLAWLDTLQRIKEMDVDLIVPGEGAPCGKEAIDPLYEYLREMRKRIVDMFDNGASRRECVDKVGMLDWFPIPEGREAEYKLRRRGSVERIYTEVRVSRRQR